MSGAGPESRRPGAGPLAGIRVAVTRPSERADRLVRPLEAAGAATLCFPLIRIVAPADPAPLRETAGRADTFDWLVFTSANGVAALAAARRTGRLPAGPSPRCAVVGPATASALETAGRAPDVIAGTSVAEGLVDALRARARLAGARILWPRAAGARPLLADVLRAEGAHLEAPEAYASAADGGQAAALAAAVRAGELDVLTFTSPSAVRSFSQAGGAVPRNVRVAAIGPVTAAAAEAAGYRVDVHAADASAEGLVEAIIRALGKRS